MSNRAERVLITGGSGFLGAGLAHALVEQGHEVHLLSRAGGSRWRLTGLEGVCRTHAADLLDADAVNAAVRAARPEVVYHLAAEGVRPGGDRVAVVRGNVLGTAHLLAALSGLDYRVLVHAGTGAEYGPCDHAVPEDAPLRPTSDYGAAKAAASLLSLAEARRGRPVVVVRIFAAYGPWEAAERLVPYVMGCCTRGQPPRVSAGLQRRDFISAFDVVELLQVAARERRALGQVLHAGTGVAHPVRDLVTTILELGGQDAVEADFGAVPARPDEPALYLADIRRTTALTGWEPRLGLRAGVARTWEWFRSQKV